MRCPFCSNEDSQVKDSRPTEDNTAIRRRRFVNSVDQDLQPLKEFNWEI